MSEQYFVQNILGDSATLYGDEAHHLGKVMRKRVGDSVVLFDGNGCEYTAKIDAVAKDKIELTLLDKKEFPRENTRRLTIAVALPKGDRQKWLIEKLTELGCDCVIPLETQRSVAEATESALIRLNRQILEATKQCARRYLMRLEKPMSLADLDSYADPETLKCVAHPENSQPFFSVAQANSLIVAIGPEGGFSDNEIDWLKERNWQSVSLGDTILRVETAALAVCLWNKVSVHNQ